MRPAAGGRLPVDDAALVVLGEGAGGFFEDGTGGVAPAFDAAGGGEVVEEVGLVGGAVGELAGEVDDVVLQGFEEVGGGDLGGKEAGFGGAGVRRRGQRVGGDNEQKRGEQSWRRRRSCDGTSERNRVNSYALVSLRLTVTV